MGSKIIVGILVVAVVGLGFYFFMNRQQQKPVDQTMVPSVTMTASKAPVQEAELVGPKWQWVKTLMNDGKITTASDSSKYTITFAKDNTYSAQADCNMVNGAYEASGSALTIKQGASTKAFCGEGSQDTAFLRSLFMINSYMIKDGQLVLMLPYDSGSMIFKK